MSCFVCHAAHSKEGRRSCRKLLSHRVMWQREGAVTQRRHLALLTGPTPLTQSASLSFLAPSELLILMEPDPTRFHDHSNSRGVPLRPTTSVCHFFSGLGDPRNTKNTSCPSHVLTGQEVWEFQKNAKKFSERVE